VWAFPVQGHLGRVLRDERLQELPEEELRKIK